MGMMLHSDRISSQRLGATSAVAVMAFGLGSPGLMPPAHEIGSPASAHEAAERDTWLGYQIARIRALKPDWDGYGANPIQQKTIGQIEGLLAQAALLSKHAGSIVPGADGSLQAEWHLANVSFGLLVEAGGRVSTWSRFADNEDEIEEVGVPNALDFLRALATQYLNV